MARLHGWNVLAAALLACAPVAAVGAPPRHRTHALPAHPRARAAPLAIAVAPGIAFETPFAIVAGRPDRIVRVPHYLGPDGTYGEYADLVKSINGTPCGQECTRRALERWGYAPVD